MQDEASGLRLVASLGVTSGRARRGGAGPGHDDGRVLFGLDFAPATGGARELRVAGAATTFAPVSLHARTRLAPLEGGTFPPGPLPLVLAPRSVEVEVDLVFRPTGPAVDFSLLLTDAEREAVRPLGDHHIEQAGTFVGRVTDRRPGIRVRGRGAETIPGGVATGALTTIPTCSSPASATISSFTP